LRFHSPNQSAVGTGGSLIGYARVSKQDQNLDLQMDALKLAGCSSLYCDKLSGAVTDRPNLQQAIDSCKPGDTLVVWKLDRLGRSLQHLIETVTLLGNRGVGFRTISDGIDTTTSGGKLIFHIFGALAEFERSVIISRTVAGLKAARERGRVGGRPKAIDSGKGAVARNLINAGSTREDVAAMIGVGVSTLRRHLNQTGNHI
jgi:DNA invertase Pin-like site-specific DNA recombinase